MITLQKHVHDLVDECLDRSKTISCQNEHDVQTICNKVLTLLHLIVSTSQLL